MSLSLTGTWRTGAYGLARCKVAKVHTGHCTHERNAAEASSLLCFALSPLGVASFDGFEPARRARRRFGPSPFRRSGRARRPQRDDARNLYKSQHAAMANFVPADARSGEGTARPGGAVARSSRVIAAGEATAQAIGPVPVAHPAVWTPGLCGSDRDPAAPWGLGPRPPRNS